jgi:limonene-1,2-epoxide hydrolase
MSENLSGNASESAMLATLKALQAANIRRDKAALLDLLSPDLEFHFHMGSKPLKGLEGMSRFLDRYWAATSELLWRIDRHAANGNKLLVEGYEEYVDTTSHQKIARPYMGIFEFRDGKIVGWRDYFEMDAPAAK